MGAAGSAATAMPLEEWNLFVGQLLKVEKPQKVRAELVTVGSFKPSITVNFEMCMSAGGESPITTADVSMALLEFGDTEDAGELQQLVRFVERSTSLNHLTVQLAYCYTLDTWFYSKLNAALRNDDENVLRTIAPIVRLMAEMPLACPKPLTGRTVLYRGLKLSEAEVLYYMQGLVFSWAAFSSFSKALERAERFAEDDGIIFVLDASEEVAQQSLTDIEDLSYFSAEREVLLSPYSSLLVRETTVVQERKHVHCELLSAGRDLSGVWDCKEDNGVYFVTCVGSLVAWFGHARPGSRVSWAHIFFGSMSGGEQEEVHQPATRVELKGSFADVPVARCRLSGPLVCEVDFQRMQMTRTLETCFMGKTWTRRSCSVQKEDQPSLSYCHSATDQGLTGCWHDAENDIVVYAREYDNGLAWFAHSSSWTCAHVAIGEQEADSSKKSWLLMYHDVVLSTRFRYSGKIRVSVVAPEVLDIESLNGPFASKRLKRVQT